MRRLNCLTCAQVRQQQGDKFSRLKAVLVNNLLKQYHKTVRLRTGGSGNDGCQAAPGGENDEAVYQLAMSEVDRIMQGGKISEKDLKR